MNIYKIIFPLALVLFLASCKKDTDDESPVVSSVLINGVSVTTQTTADAGTDMTVQIKMTDNESLNQLKIDLHPNADGHTHGDGEEGETADGDWEVLEIINLSGTSYTYNHTYAIPEESRGEWHFGISVLDESGNESEDIFIDLDIENDIIPLIEISTINGAEVEGEIDVQEGEVLNLEGTVTDASGLASIALEIIDEDGNVQEEVEIDPASATSFDLSGQSITVPAFTTDHMELHVHAVDVEGYESEWTVELHAD